MRKLYLIAIAGIFISSCGSDDDSNSNTPTTPTDTTSDITQYPGYTLSWNDEFNDTKIDLGNWTHETGDGTDYGLPAGWGFNELQINTDDTSNSSIILDSLGNSVLAITALKSGNSYTSARLSSFQKFEFRFGRMEIRMKLPGGNGMWATLRAFGVNFETIGWPGCGEIDIFDVIGNTPNKLYNRAIYVDADNELGSHEGDYTLSNSSFSNNYHILRFDWTPDNMTFYIDEDMVQTIPIEDDMKEFLRSQTFILSLAVGGNAPGNPDANTIFPNQMLVDYIRIYSKDDLNASDPPELDPREETIGQYVDRSILGHMVKEGFNTFDDIDVNIVGDGGEPSIIGSSVAIDGDSSVLFSYPGSNWGGAYFRLGQPVDLSASSVGNLYFSINTQADLNDMEVKLESPNSNASIFIVDYQATDLGNGWLEYSIPMADFENSGLDLSDVVVPFAFWNPRNSNGDFAAMDILIDNIYVQ
ncbi:MAG: family 16 glycosylhydrolase [Cytophagales bacterium]